MRILPPARRARLLWTLAAVATMAGWTDLAHGGTVAGPIILVMGYLVLVPVALLAP